MSFIIDGVEIQSIIVDGLEINSMIVDGVEVFSGKTESYLQQFQIPSTATTFVITKGEV